MARHLSSPFETVPVRALLLVVLGLLATGCAASPTAMVVDPDDASAVAIATAIAAPEAGEIEITAPTIEEALAPTATAGTAEADSAPSDVDEPAAEPTPRYDFGDTALPDAPVGLESLTPEALGRQPIAIEIEAIDVVDATVIPVGVNPDQTFEVPPADQVGWYRFGPTPGDEGSAVLAAHIAFDGVDGVFRRLADAEVGAVVVVSFDDGTSQRYRIESVTDYEKEELPAELFARSGDASLALITCGGDFNPQLRSYDSNTVAVAVPI